MNSASIIWQKPETEFWKNKLKNLLKEYSSETESKISKNILNNFSNEIKNFKQVCPIEMLDKLDNPIVFKKNKAKVS